MSVEFESIIGGYRQLSPAEQSASVAATAQWWDEEAQDYYRDHGATLGDTELHWCPEGLRESAARLLGDVAGRDVVEFGAGAAQGSRYLYGQGARVVATDISAGMLAQARELNEDAGIDFPLLTADAREIPLPDQSADICFTAHGGIAFVPDPVRIHQEAARLLRPGGLWVCSLPHPVRWMFPDVPGAAGLTVTRSYFSNDPYVERTESGRIVYAEYHRTLSQHVADVLAAGLVIEAIDEPTWLAGDLEWNGWSRLRGELMPGTLIISARKPA
ncbi:MAG: class I SAM-dependent methyltransferase [Buchananella hordeovulneris]|nr:class I SAM-dependent methyltransferase [Buchananella hordeovulneris]